MYDAIVIGGGPAGMTAALTIARNDLSCLLLADMMGGQLALIGRLDNWPGTPQTSGAEVAKSFTGHLARYTNFLEIRHKDAHVQSVVRSGASSFIVKTNNGALFSTRALIVATGAEHATLGVAGEERLAGQGVSYCAACDAPYFRGKRVAVVGDTPEAETTAKLLAEIASEVSLLRPDKDTHEGTAERYAAITGVTVTEIIGQDRVSGLRYKDAQDTENDMEIDGVFIEAGFRPNSYPVNELAALNKAGHVVVDSRTMATSCPGLFAAGDVTDGEYKQVATAVGDGTKAALSAVRYIQDNRRG